MAQAAAPMGLRARNFSNLSGQTTEGASQASAMPDMSEVFFVPGNKNLSKAARLERFNGIYEPFYDALAQILTRRQKGVLVTVHSFTPAYHGVLRDCEIGLLHDSYAKNPCGAARLAQCYGRNKK